MKKLLICSIVAISFTSCVTPSFQDSYTNGNVSRLNGSNVNQLSGKYKMFASKEYDEKGTSTYLKADNKRYSFSSHIENNIPNVTTLRDVEKILRGLDSESIEWVKEDEVEVKINKGYISFTLLKGNQPVKTYTYKAEVKNGFVYLPQETNCVKVPLVIDGCVKSEIRVGLGTHGGLLLHEVNKINTSSNYLKSFLKYYGDKENIVYGFDRIN